MKITKLLIIITLPMFIFSQEKNQINKDERHKRMKSRKIAFISDQLNFTPDKAQVFWPIYNQYTSELNSIMDDKKKLMENYKNNGSLMNDEDLGKIISDFFDLDQRYLDLKIKYVKRFSKIISNKQLFELYNAEESFKKDLLRRIKRGDNKTGSILDDLIPKDIKESIDSIVFKRIGKGANKIEIFQFNNDNNIPYDQSDERVIRKKIIKISPELDSERSNL